MRKSAPITKRTAAELEAMEARGEAGSDWARAARVPPPDGSDPDDAWEAGDPAWGVAGIPPHRERKAHTNLRLDAEVLRWFKDQGPGYQTRINAVLRRYYEHHNR